MLVLYLYFGVSTDTVVVSLLHWLHPDHVSHAMVTVYVIMGIKGVCYIKAAEPDVWCLAGEVTMGARSFPGTNLCWAIRALNLPAYVDRY